MADISHEEMGTSCDSCGNGGAMCCCLTCKDCGDKYDRDDIRYNMCPDCLSNFQSTDLEHQIDKAMHTYEPQPSRESGVKE